MGVRRTKGKAVRRMAISKPGFFCRKPEAYCSVLEYSKKLKPPFLGKEVRRRRTSFPKNGGFNFLLSFYKKPGFGSQGLEIDNGFILDCPLGFSPQNGFLLIKRHSWLGSFGLKHMAGCGVDHGHLLTLGGAAVVGGDVGGEL